MGKPLSTDLRSRVIAAVSGGLSRRSAAAQFHVSVASAIRWVHAHTTTGTVCAKPQGGDTRSHHIEAFSQTILSAIEAQKDISLDELADLLRARHDASFATSTIWRFLNRHGLSFKKNSPRSRAGTARRRRAATGLVRSPA